MNGPARSPSYRCIICGCSYEWGHDTWHTMRYVQGWNALVCQACDQHDGVVPSPELERRLTGVGIPVRYNASGYIAVPR